MALIKETEIVDVHCNYTEAQLWDVLKRGVRQAIEAAISDGEDVTNICERVDEWIDDNFIEGHHVRLSTNKDEVLAKDEDEPPFIIGEDRPVKREAPQIFCSGCGEAHAPGRHRDDSVKVKKRLNIELELHVTVK